MIYATPAAGTTPEAIERGASDLEIEALEKATVVDVDAYDGGSYSGRSSRIAAESIDFASSIPATPVVSFSGDEQSKLAVEQVCR